MKFYVDFLIANFIIFVLFCNTFCMKKVLTKKQETIPYVIRLDNDLKMNFLSKSRKMGLSWWVILRNFMQDFCERENIFEFNLKADYMDELVNRVSVKQNIWELSSELDKIWF